VETIESLGIESAVWVGHSFGGRLAAELAARRPELAQRLALLDPGLMVPPDRALRGAEIERLDWSFATVDGAVNALLSNESMVAPPARRDHDLRAGRRAQGRRRPLPLPLLPQRGGGRLSEMNAAAAPGRAGSDPHRPRRSPLADVKAHGERYLAQLGDLLTLVEVPNGHNVLWESPRETIAAVERFLEPVRA
jgi:pimeloyl-ACP methyl ester carboxylesterase